MATQASLLQKKLDHMTDNKKQVQEAKGKIYETAQTAKDRTTETKNQEKLGHMTDNKKQVQEAKEKVHGTAQTPKDRTTETINQVGSKPSEKTGAATNDKVSAVAQSAKESALAAKDKTTTVLEKTSVQVKGHGGKRDGCGEMHIRHGY